MIDESTLPEYMDALASKAATPGGGAAAGVTGAQACALMEMVCSLTRTDDSRIAEIRTRAAQTRARLMSLATQDMEKFNKVMAAFRLPPGERARHLQPALEEAAQVPLEMIGAATALIDSVETLTTIGNPNLITDTGIAALLIEAAIRSCRLNVLVNLKSIDDQQFVAQANVALSAALTRLPALTAIVAGIDATLLPNSKGASPSSPID